MRKSWETTCATWLSKEIGFVADPVNQRLAKQVRRGRKPASFLNVDEWTRDLSVTAGKWMLEEGLRLSYFTTDERGFPVIAPEWQEDIAAIRQELLWRSPYMLPHTKPPPDWVGWRTRYDDRLQATFVRDWRSETREAITEALH